MMDSRTLHLTEDMKELEQSPPSSRSDEKDSALSFQSEKRGNSSGDRARTKTRKPKHDPDRDRVSDGGRSSASYYSDDYENASLSDRSFSSRSRSPSPPGEGKRRGVSSSPSRTRMHKGVSRRPGPRAPHPHRTSTLRSQSLGKDAPPKDLDLVTKRLLSARLLKISELKNALSEQQLRADELQRENRLLRQLQLRQEKALHRYDDTESEISQLISRHSNEAHALRERLRRCQDRERAAERRCKDADAQLRRCKDQLHKLRQLADDKQLGERDELRRSLAHTQLKAHENEQRVKELEKNLELSTGSFQRQLTNERKKTHDALQDVRVLREEVERLSAKLKERERELDTRNIYANRMLRGASRKEFEDVTKRKVLSASGRSSSKAVQTEDALLCLEFPPPLAITNGSQFPSDDQADKYPTLKELQRSDLVTQREREKARGIETEPTYSERDMDREQDKFGEVNRRFEKEKLTSSSINTGTRRRDEWGSEDEDRKKLIQQQNEEKKQKDGSQTLTERELQAARVQTEEQRRRKEQLLAKLREVDMQAQGQSGGTHSPPPHLSELHNESPSVLSFTEPTAVRKRAGTVTSQNTDQDLDLIFGSYAPSFGKPASRSGPGPRSTPQTANPFTANGEGGTARNGPATEKKSLLMQQLFGSSTASLPSDRPSQMELLSSSSTKPVSGGFGGRRRDTETPDRQNSPGKPTLHSHSDLVLKAITSLDEDIEELKL